MDQTNKNIYWFILCQNWNYICQRSRWSISSQALGPPRDHKEVTRISQWVHNVGHLGGQSDVTRGSQEITIMFFFCMNIANNRVRCNLWPPSHVLAGSRILSILTSTHRAWCNWILRRKTSEEPCRPSQCHIRYVRIISCETKIQELLFGFCIL